MSPPLSKAATKKRVHTEPVTKPVARAKSKPRAKGVGDVLPPPEADLFPALKIKNGKDAIKALGLKPLRARSQSLTEAQVAKAVAVTETLHGRPKPSVVAAALADVQVGQVVDMPIHFVRPGQAQISLTNVRQKMEDFVERVDQRLEEFKDKKSSSTELLDSNEALTVVVGPGAKYLVLTDGHHHVAALKATQALVGQIIGNGMIAHAKGSAGALASVNALFGGAAGVPSIPLHVIGDYRALSEGEFWKKMKGGVEGRRLAYLETRAGKTLKEPPVGFGRLEENPYRYLASVLTGKLELKGAGKHKVLEVRGGDPPVWLKTIGRSPDFIEFHLARVLERAYREAGRVYAPDKPLTAADRDLARYALFRAKLDPTDPEHAPLADLIITTKDRSLKSLSAKIDFSSSGLEIPRKIVRPSKRRLRFMTERFERLQKKAAKKGTAP